MEIKSVSSKTNGLDLATKFCIIYELKHNESSSVSLHKHNKTVQHVQNLAAGHLSLMHTCIQALRVAEL